MSGSAISALQTKLQRLGFYSGNLDGIFGPATDLAVKAFQRAAGLIADGIVGPRTDEALANSGAQPVPQTSLYGPAALAEALTHVGYSEQPPGSNKTKFGEWFGVNGVAWCAMFMSYCFSRAGITLAAGYNGAGVNKKGCAYCPTVEAWLRVEEKWIGRTIPQSGDLVLFQFDRDPEPDHIGIVDKVYDATHFSTVEGNVSSEVKSLNRTMDQVQGFGRL